MRCTVLVRVQCRTKAAAVWTPTEDELVRAVEQLHGLLHQYEERRGCEPVQALYGMLRDAVAGLER